MRKKKEMFLALKSQERGAIIGGALVSVLILMLTVSNGSAFEIHSDSDWAMRWDNTVKYNLGYRLTDQDHKLVDDINTDDGDRNFDPGLTSNRLDLLSEMDITYRDFGLRVSGAAWVDLVYLSDNDNDSPATFNGEGEHDEFADATERLHGRKAEILDAFLFGKGELMAFPVSFRAGRHTVLWGESLFMATNAISYGQAPLDFIKAIGVPGTQSKELFMPQGQLSGQIQLSDHISIAAFSQFEWRRTRAPASGSYFSDMDLVDSGAEKLLLGPNFPGAPGPAFFKGNDLGAGNSRSEYGEGNLDQYGISTRFRIPKIDTEFGLYYVHYNEKSPLWIYIDPTKVNPAIGKAGEYFLVFPEDIHLIGISLSTQVGPVNVSGEVSGRIDTPLVSSPQVIMPGTRADNHDHALYAVGNTLHANLSAIYMMNTCSLWHGGNIMGEVGYNYLIDTTENESALDPSRDDYAWGFRMVFEPAYYQLIQNVDIRVPIGLGYNPAGKSPVDLKFNNGGADRGGDVSVGLNVDYLQVWRFGVKYTNYFGSSDTQTLKDRDFISISAQRTF
ncbi:MAG: DUF1302 domain-containing protein [Pseudomonadota bacterium]